MLYLSRPPSHGIISAPPGTVSLLPHRNAIAATLENDAVSRTLRSSDRFCGRRVFFFWRRGFVLRRFGVVLVRERVGGELRGGHGCPGPSSSHGAPSERAAANKSTRGARRMSTVGRFLGGWCLWLFLLGDALGLQPRLECRVVGSRSDEPAAFLRFDPT